MIASREFENALADSASLAARIVTAPQLVEPKHAHAALERWRSELSPNEREALAGIFAAAPLVETLLQSLTEHSPFLWDLASREPARLLRLLQTNPELHFTKLLADTSASVAASEDEAEAMRLLRRMRSEAALLIALADIGGVWPLTRITHALTELADAAVIAAVRFALVEAARAGRIVLKDSHKVEEGSGYFVLAMGKMGAFELNYSSDIDLIVFYDQTSPILAEGAVPATTFVRITQRVVKLLQERTGDGYVFRTDLRLRPDPASTAIAISTAAAADYYESAGQNWERAAMIKARVCAGDIAAGEKFLNDLTPFIWRKHLDFAALADVHAMKQQIAAYRGHGEIAVEGHNIKLGRGGIREIEFFAQSQQLIAGGRNPHLRNRDTLSTLDQLEHSHWIDAAARDEMKAAYFFLRTVEHRLQMVEDEQTQTLPAEQTGVERFARFLGFTDRDAFAAALLIHLNNVQRTYSRLFEKTPGPERSPLLFPTEADDHKTLDRLSELGFPAPLEASSIIRHWLNGEYRSIRSETVRAQIKALLPILLEHLARTDNPNAVLVLFDHFLSNLSSGVRLFSLLQQNPELISIITLVLGTAPRLAGTLARHPHVMDSLIEPNFFEALADEAELNRRLNSAMAQARYEEDLLERIRMFGLEHMFLIGVRILTGTVSARQAGEAFARLADVVMRAVQRAVSENFSKTYGYMHGSAVAILAMGKLGGYEMTASSDLDLLLIYRFDEAFPESTGPRALYGGQYFSRLTQRLINALTVQTNYGALYDIDMRLRPSGRSGPLATKIESFADYQESEAWTWEHMALTRARIVSAPPEFAAQVQEIIGSVLRRPRDPVLIAGDVVEMRAAIAKEKPDNDRWDLKYVAGGLIDIEFIAQYLQLVHASELPEILDTSTAGVLDKAWRLRVLAVEDAEILRPAAQLYHDLTQILRLCLTGPFDPKSAGAGLLRLLARAADVPDFATLDATLIEAQAKVRESFVRILGKSP